MNSKQALADFVDECANTLRTDIEGTRTLWAEMAEVALNTMDVVLPMQATIARISQDQVTDAHVTYLTGYAEALRA